jgi:hypothetical protein
LPDELGSIQQIDLIEIKDRKITWAFEIEYITAITKAFNRCSNITKDYGTRKAVIQKNKLWIA